MLNQGVPLEVGLALDERALDGLRGPMQHDPAEGGDHAHEDFDAYAVPMPAQNPTPYKFIELDWNPAGHPPEDIYTLPHFDFHFCKTYDGAVIFQEPMITREFILSKPNVEIPLPMAAQVTPAGYYPSAYSITYDAQAKEHGIALTKMNWQN